MKRLAGFSLIELMVTITVFAILIAIAAPSFQQFIVNNRIVAATNDLVADLAMARSEAIKRGGSVQVTVCASNDGSSCSGDAAWTGGRLLFVDGGTIGTVDGTDSAGVLRTNPSINGLTLSSSGFSTTGYISYLSDGSVTSSTLGSITICSTGYVGRVLSVSSIGRTTLSKTTGNCS